MKKFVALFLILVAFSVFPSHSAHAERAEYLYVLKDEFMASDKVLVVRTAPLYKDELWVVEYGVGCSGMWRFEDKKIIATYSMYLDGVGGDLILPQSGTCRLWDADKLEDVDKEDLRYEDWEWLEDNGFVDGLSSRYTPPTTVYSPPPKPTSSCPLNSNPQAGQCVCNQGYILYKKLNICIDFNTSCHLQYGEFSYGNADYCYCKDGYEFSAQNVCVKKAAFPPPSSLIFEVPMKCENGSLKSNGDCSCNSGFVWSDTARNCVALAPTPSASVVINNDADCKRANGSESYFDKDALVCLTCEKGMVLSNKDHKCYQPCPNNLQFNPNDNLCYFVKGVPKTKDNLMDCPVVGVTTNRLYYLRGSAFLKSASVKGKICFPTEQEAMKAKYRKAKK